uniref:Uncharacterized protein n=1 Tax=Arundo donax TaxID=35708 RepID=A0A0A9GXY3_ARUDO
MLRSIPDPKINTEASTTPIAAAKSKAEDMEGSLFLSPFLLHKFPEANCEESCLETSSATNEVVMLRSGMLKSFDIMLTTDTPTAAEASSTGPKRPI